MVNKFLMTGAKQSRPIHVLHAGGGDDEGVSHMRALLTLTATALTVAMLATSPAPALARDGDSSASNFRDDRRGDRRPGFRSGDDLVFVSDRERLRNRGDTFLYPPEYQGDSVWKHDSFNDWWHERPNRAYPAWMLRNQDCQRQWVQGNVLTC
jgi:hypothetical protein